MSTSVSPADLTERDTAARLRALTDLDSTLLVEAGAGSGKTSVLAGRIVMLLASGRAPTEIAAITFTEAAASELRQRVEEFVSDLMRGKTPIQLQLAWPDGPTATQRRALSTAAAELDALACTTIHGFCRLLLTHYPVEARIDPGAAIADDDAAALIFDDVLRDFLHARLSNEASADDPVAALFLADESRPEDLISDLAQNLRRYRGAGIGVYPHEREACAGLRQTVADYRAFLSGAPCQEPETEEIVAALETLLASLPGEEAARVPALLALMRLPAPAVCSTVKGAFTAYRKLGKWRAVAKARGSQAEAERLHAQAADLYAACRDAHAFVQGAAAGCLLSLIGGEVVEVVNAFQREKRMAALLDFDDLLHGTRDLLTRSEDVRAALGTRYRYVLVDEFQDTDALQAEILWRLCCDPPSCDPATAWTEWPLRDGALFMVGDPKQGIYRFRGADVGTYLRARAALEAVHPDNVLGIGRNFRSVVPILDWVNERFEAPLSADGQPGFAPLFTDDLSPAGSKSVFALDVSVPDGARADAMRDAEAEAVAEICARLIGAYAVRDRDKSLRPCRAGDIALLAPTGTELWRYERALEARFIPVATQAGKGFFRRQEIQDLIALASTLADARDTLALGALLRGPLVGLTEEVLLDALAELPAAEDRYPRLHLWLPFTEVRDPLLRQTLEILQGLARRARSTTPTVLLAEAIEEMRVRPLLRQRGGRAAERALANIDAFLDMTRAYETRGLRAFAQAMRLQWSDETRAKEARPDAEREAVSLVTMHAAKGLEWAIVVPVNTATTVMATRLPVLDRATSLLHTRLMDCAPPGCDDAVAAETEQIRLERQRLWYVAGTRARDLLLLPRLSCNLPANAWANAIDLGWFGLSPFDPTSLPSSSLPPVDSFTNTQDRAIFETEAALIAAHATHITRITPSRAEADSAPAETEVLPLPDLPEAPSTELPPGGRGRGLVLHKLVEEALTGETADDATELATRAAELSAICEMEAEQLDPIELAATVLRALALPEIAALRPRLVPELAVHASFAREEEEQIVSGIADAVALAPDGTIEVVVDWKSDVSSVAETVDGYRSQVRAYLQATGASRGLIVLMTPGIALEVEAPAQTAS
jgi:ATP-dependent exoDNAse (exonuclease V) beta subunit